MNPADLGIEPCNCRIFQDDLLQFLEEIILDMSVQQWKKFKIFVKKNLHKYPHPHIPLDMTNPKNDPHQRLCKQILKKQNEFERSGIKLPVVLANLISLTYLEQCLFNCEFSYKFVLGKEGCLLKFNETTRLFTALDGRSEYMKLLVKLDLVGILKANLPGLFQFGIWRNLMNFMSTTEEDFERSFSRRRAIEELAKNIFFCAHYHRSLERLYMTTVAIQAAELNFNKVESVAKDYIYCLRMYFAVTRDPLLTLNEVRCMLYASLFIFNKLHLFEPFYEGFVELMPECPAKLQPRNLADLARCQVRKNLKKYNLPLAAAVEKVSLPRLLKRFVLGDIIDVSRNCGNVSPENIITRSQLAELVSRSPRS